MREIGIVNAGESVEEFFEVDDLQLESGAQRYVQSEALEEPVVIAFQFQRVGHPQCSISCVKMTPSCSVQFSNLVLD